MTRLSVNLNKVALLRNARNTGTPSVIEAAETIIDAGALGITVHPRPDQRHIRTTDVFELAKFLSGHRHVEFNIEGNPFPEFMEIVQRARPTQCTLVPDAANAATSDHGWNLEEEGARLRPIITTIRDLDVRVVLFMDAENTQWQTARELGADRVELYTQPYAEAFVRDEHEKVFKTFATAAKVAQSAGLGVKAGHDLNLQNLAHFCRIPGILEVSIGHALIADALHVGLANAVREYLRLLTANS